MTGTRRARTLVITGASSGIGRAAALEAAGGGHRLVLVARGATALADVAAACERAGATHVVPEAVDIGDDEAVAELFARVRASQLGIDAVLNFAGVVAYGRTHEVPAAVFERVLRTNLLGSANLARHALPQMREQGHGTLVLCGSVLGHIAAPLLTPYAVSKWGVRALAHHLRLENRDVPGIHVAYVAPGGVDTPIYAMAANFAGFVGRPPPPVTTAKRVARASLRQLERPRASTQLGVANHVMRFGFTFLPGLYDRLVGPLFTVAALDRTRPVPPGAGNVLESREEAYGLASDQSGAARGILRNLRVVVGQRLASHRLGRASA